MKRSIMFTATILFATTCCVPLQAEQPSAALVTNAVMRSTSSDAAIVQVSRRGYRRNGYRPSYRYSRPYNYYSPYGSRYNYRPYSYGPGYYGTRPYGYYNYGPSRGGLRVGPVGVWW